MLKINLPTSKSISARALIINALAPKPCTLCRLSDCDDTRALQGVLAGGNDIGAAGTAMRFSTAYLAARESEEEVVLTGSARMLERPIGILVEALRSLGADIVYEGAEGYPPLRIRGRRLQGGEVTIPAHVSSQYISALMMVAPTLADGLTLHLDGKIASLPYIEMTRALMREWKVESRWLDDHTLYIPSQTYERAEDYVVEPDWSAASYFYEVVLTESQFSAEGSAIFVPHLRVPSVQGDSAIVAHFERLGVSTEFVPDGAILRRCEVNDTAEVCIDFSDIPDMAQTFVVTCCMLGRAFHFKGLESLKIKETNRVAALIAECLKLGYVLTEPTEGELQWDGVLVPVDKSARISIATYKDHRMAMAFAPACSSFPGIFIEEPTVVAKSFPNFWEEFGKIGITK